jgi:hypothetical protein
MPKAKEILEKAQESFDAFDQQVKSLTVDAMANVPKQDVEPQTKLSTKEIAKYDAPYLKPSKTISCRDQFNERFRKQYEFQKEYVRFIAENREIIGEKIEIWCRPFGGLDAQMFEVPTNKPVWGPRYLAEQIKRKFYHRLVMQNAPTGQSGEGTFYGNMVADTTIQRLDAMPAKQTVQISMVSNF